MSVNSAHVRWTVTVRRGVWTVALLMWTGLRLVANGLGLLLVLLISLWPVALLLSWDPAGWTLVPYYLITATLAGVGVTLLVLPKGREWMTKPANAGEKFPYWFAGWVALTLILLAIDLFATITWQTLGDSGVLVSDGGRPLSHERLMDFYLWHALEFVPLLDVTKTLDWQVPVVYSGAGVGWLLLAFKGVIVVPIVLALRSFRRSWKLHRPDLTQTGGAGG